MQAIWKGSVAFGLVSIPVKAFVATESRDVSFRQVHAADGGRIQYRKVCSVCGETVQQAQIAKAYETDTGELLVLDDADFAGLPVRTTKEIEVLQFVPAEQVDPILFERTYYLEPDERAAKPYLLLVEALRSTDRLAVVMVTLRQKTHLAALRVHDGLLTLQTLLWPDEVRRPQFPALDADVELRPAELAMAASLVESMAGDFDPSEHTDDYRVALMAMLEDKMAGGDGVVAAPAAEETSGEVLDLMAALEASVARARAGTEVKATTDKARKAEPKPEKVKKAVQSTSRSRSPKSGSPRGGGTGGSAEAAPAKARRAKAANG